MVCGGSVVGLWWIWGSLVGPWIPLSSCHQPDAVPVAVDHLREALLASSGCQFVFSSGGRNVHVFFSRLVLEQPSNVGVIGFLCS